MATFAPHRRLSSNMLTISWAGRKIPASEAMSSEIYIPNAERDDRAAQLDSSWIGRVLPASWFGRPVSKEQL